MVFRQGDRRLGGAGPLSLSLCTIIESCVRAGAFTLLRNMRISRRQKDDNMNHEPYRRSQKGGCQIEIYVYARHI